VFVPLLTALCNRVGASTVWLIYPVLINFYVVVISVPALVVGTNLGLIFGKVIPELYTTIVGFVLWGYLIVNWENSLQ
jgi:hypothetical protein